MEQTDTIRTIDEFRSAYFPKDVNRNIEYTDPEAMGRELARRSAILVKAAFASV